MGRSKLLSLIHKCKCKEPGFDPWFGEIPWRRERLPTSVFWPGLENSVDCVVHGVAKSRTRLSDFHSRMKRDDYVKLRCVSPNRVGTRQMLSIKHTCFSGLLAFNGEDNGFFIPVSPEWGNCL